MHVIKRNGEREPVDFNKITHRIKTLSTEISDNVDPIKVAQKVCNSLYDNVRTTELDELSSEISIALCTEHPDYGVLAAHLCTSNLHKSTCGSFVECTRLLHARGLVSDVHFQMSVKHGAEYEAMMDYERDYHFDYFGLKTLTKSYLLKIDDRIVERPQDMWMRVSVGIHEGNMVGVRETYDHMSRMYFTHATPTLFNAGTNYPQLSSCYLVEMQDDSISGIFSTLEDCAQISKWAGGIGLNIHKLRATGADIRKSTGVCTGIIPSLRVFNATSRYVNQGGKRPGSIAVYLSVDHPDIFKFLDMRKNHGDEEERCRDLFSGLWISDLFMERVRENKQWSLFCPHSVPESLQDVYGERYRELYLRYESEGLYKRQVPAMSLWLAICNAQIETGNPYMLYKDAVNEKTNQKNVGVIKSSNLCTEILEYTAPDEIAVCNLASIALPKFVVRHDDSAEPFFDHVKLHSVVKLITRNLNRVIDINFYPVDKAKRSNFRHRPIGIGVQGLADVYMMFKIPFESHEAAKLNHDIFETIYHAAMEQSCELADTHGAYETFEGSPLSRGVFQFDMWNTDFKYPVTNDRYDWDQLRTRVMSHGTRNSLLIAPMPTASTSQILGNNECIEPYTSNLYARRTLAGEFVVLNKHLIKDLIHLGLWSSELKNKIIFHNGSVQDILNIPDTLKSIYKTAWEIKQRALIDQAVERGKFVCQSQSLNLFMAKPTIKALSSMHFYAWGRGLKTGLYYLRTQPATNPIQFTISPCESCSS